MSKYIIQAEVIDGCDIKAYVLKDTENNKKKVLNIDDTITLARDNKIDNAKVVTVKDTHILCIDGGNDSLEKTNTAELKRFNMTIICRLVDSNNKCIGYKVRNTDGKVLTLTMSKVWELASYGCINGVIGTINGSNKVLREKEGFSFSEIQTMSNIEN